MSSTIFELQTGFLGILWLVLTAVKLYALIDAVLRPAQAYVAADKLTKQAWLWILGLTLAAHFLIASSILSLAGIVAAFVYLLDVRPALASVTRRR